MATFVVKSYGFMMSFDDDELDVNGPQIPVAITPRVEQLNDDVTRVQTMALIDTGWRHSVFDRELVSKLSLQPKGAMQYSIPSMPGSIRDLGFEVTLFLKNGSRHNLFVAARDIAPISMILGRDFLKDVKVEYDGKAKRVRFFT